MDQTDQIVAELQQIGLPEKEARVYLASLELGEATAQQIAVRAIVNRPTTYVMIESLAKRGLMSSVIRGKKRYFAAEPPSRLVNQLNDEQKIIQKKMRVLSQIMNTVDNKFSKNQKPRVRIFEGRAGIKAIVDDIIASGPKQSVEITDMDALYSVLSTDDTAIIRNQLSNLRANRFGLISGRIRTVLPKKSNIRILPKKFRNFGANIGIYGSKIAMVTFGDEMYSLIIDNSPLTRTLSILFDLASEASKKFPKAKN